MVVSDFRSFSEWLFGDGTVLGASLLTFLLVVVTLGVLGLLFGYTVSAIRHGMVDGFRRVSRVLAGAVSDFVFISPRRVFAMAKLAVQESIRRRVMLVTFLLFALALLVGGWFLDRESDHPGKLYITVVLWGSTMLILVLVWLLSCFSLPMDIRNRTIHTVVTKPVRVSEIVLGRIIGFSLIGTVLLAAMGLVSYLFVIRGLSHSHTLESSGTAKETSFDNHHRHAVQVMEDGSIELDERMGHTHTVEVLDDGTRKIGSPEGELQARVPLYGKLRFLDEHEQEREKGINVGDEWDYRSYIEGDTRAAAVWTFENIRLDRFLGGLTSDERRAVLTSDDERSAEQEDLVDQANKKIVLPIEMTIEVFRTHKGDIESQVNGSIVLKHPSKPLRATFPFESAEYSTLSYAIPRIVVAYEETEGIKPREFEADIFKDLTEDGKLEIYLYCDERGQYFGAAQADLYIRATDRPFAWNFFKGVLSIWFQMIILVCFGVMFSTFLNLSVSLLATAACAVLGYFSEFIRGVASGDIVGGGPLESTIKMLTQQTVTTDLDIGFATDIVHGIDIVLMQVMRAITAALPDFQRFDWREYVANGFDVGGNMVAINFTMMLGFAVVLTVLSYFLLKTREMAA